MDITLIPTKLNGTTNARPSVTYSLLHATCQALALHQVRTGASDAATANAARAKDYTRLPGCWSKDLEVVLHCFESLSGDAPTLFCADNLDAFSMMLPIAALTKQKVAFTGSGEFPNSILLPMADVLKPRGVTFSRGTLKIKRRDRDRIHEICTLTKRASYGAYSLTGREDPYFIAGLLLALPLHEGNSSVRMTTMPDSTELPDMTISVLRQYGVTVLRSVDDYGYPFYEIPGNQKLCIPDTVSLEGDWTRAAFWLGCGALGGKAELFLFAGADFEKEEKFYAPYARFLSEEEFFDVCDIITVMGGDGSILQVAPQAAAAGKPILGINCGRLLYRKSDNNDTEGYEPRC